MAKHAPVILQMSDTECGVTALAMIFGYFKVNFSLEELREKCGAGRDGCSAKTLIDIATEYNFEASAYRVEPDALAHLQHPVIAYWKFSHYVVINQLSKAHACINDPAHGKVYLPIDELNHLFTGIILNLEPKQLTKKNKKQPNKIKTNILIHFTDWSFIIICLVITSFAPYLLAIVLNAGIQVAMSDLTVLNYALFIIMLLCIPIILLLSGLFYKIFTLRITKHVTTLAHRKLVSHLLHLPMSFFALRQRSEIISNLIRSEHANSNYITQTFNRMSHHIIVAACVAGMLYINLIAFIVFSMVTTGLLLIELIINKHINRGRKTHSIHSKFYAYTQSCLQNIESIHTNSIHDYIKDQWQKILANHLLVNDKVNTLQIWNMSLSKAQAIILLICLLILSINTHMINPLEIGLSYVLQMIILNSLKNIIDSHVHINNLNDQFTRVAYIATYPIDPRFSQTPARLTLPNSTCKAISCRHISFRYSKHTKVILKNIQLEVHPSEHVVITGHTASGKSTLAKLLCGLFPCHVGKILLFGRPINHYNAEELASICSYISHDVDLLPGSLYDNLTSFNDQIDPQRVTQMIKICRLEKLVARVGLHHAVETNRHTFSGGEKQRIELARTLIKNCPLLILDEAMSALDDKTINSIISYLKATNKTIIYITHHTQHASYCQRIFKLENGELIAC